MEATGGESILYPHGRDLLVEKGGSGWVWHLSEGLGAVRQLVDGDREVTLAEGYTPFGVAMWDTGSGTTGYGFTRERWQPSRHFSVPGTRKGAWAWKTSQDAVMAGIVRPARVPGT